MLDRKWHKPLTITVLVHVIILGLITTTLTYARPPEPEYMEVTVAELYTPPEPIDTPADTPQQVSSPVDSARPAATKPSAAQSAIQPLVAAGVATDGFAAPPQVSTGVGTANTIGSYGDGSGVTTGQSGTGTGVAGPPRPSRGVGVTAQADPDYPDVARQNGWEGTVKLRVTVSAQGAIEDVQVAGSSGYSQLDQSAVSCVYRRWQFSPAIREGTPVPGRAVVSIKFRIQ